MELTISQLISFLPILLVVATVLVVMLMISVKRNHWWTATATVLGLNMALFSIYFSWHQGVQPLTSLMIIDGHACLYMAMILICALASSTLINAYVEGFADNKEEVYLLLCIATIGGLVLACSRHMASLFIGLEILSVPLYGMIAYTFRTPGVFSLEGGIKYMILSAAASAFILFGMALLYSQLGGLSFSDLKTGLGSVPFAQSPVVLGGVAMMFVGFAFKLSLVPFHLWTPDVYEGAPAPVGAFLATASKVAVFAAFIRFLLDTGLNQQHIISDLLILASVLSIIVGNLLALMQKNLKRILGYSSIAHFGYLLIAVVAGGHFSQEVIAVYLLAYILTNVCVMGVISLFSSPFSSKDADMLEDYRGLFWRRPYLTAVLTPMMLSLAGVPLTAGFIGKFYVVMSGVDAHLWGLLAALVLGSALGIYYYLRVIVTLYLPATAPYAMDASSDWGHRLGGIMVILTTLLVVAMGVYPQPIIDIIRAIL